MNLTCSVKPLWVVNKTYQILPVLARMDMGNPLMSFLLKKKGKNSHHNYIDDNEKIEKKKQFYMRRINAFVSEA